MDDLGAVGAVQSKGIGGAAFRLINTKKLEFKVFNRTEKCIYNMKKFGDISTLSSGDRIKAGQEAVLSSQGLHTASGVVTFRWTMDMYCDMLSDVMMERQDRAGDAGCGHCLVCYPGRKRKEQVPIGGGLSPGDRELHRRGGHAASQEDLAGDH